MHNPLGAATKYLLSNNTMGNDSHSLEILKPPYIKYNGNLLDSVFRMQV